MIFDDHDIRDDWNTSLAWREEMARQDWWTTRIRAGLGSYWVYQHIGNLDPDTLAADELYRAVTSAEGDVWPLIEAYAARADAAVGQPEGVRWSYRWDLGRTRLLIVDSRCGRVLNAQDRLMINDDTFTWIEEQASEDPQQVDHLLLGSSIPWLMPPAASQAQMMNERSAAAGSRLAEKLRQGVDLEHWPAFRASFDRLARLVERVGSSSSAPQTVCVLSGDVHHSYAARAGVRDADALTGLPVDLLPGPQRRPVVHGVRVRRRVDAPRRLAGAPARPLVGGARGPRHVGPDRRAVVRQLRRDAGDPRPPGPGALRAVGAGRDAGRGRGAAVDVRSAGASWKQRHVPVI